MELQDRQNNDLKGQVNKLAGDLSCRDKELSRLREESGRQISHLSHQLEEQRSQFGQVKKQNSRLQEELDRVMKKVTKLLCNSNLIHYGCIEQTVGEECPDVPTQPEGATGRG